MPSSRLASVALVTLCFIALGAGSFFAVRQNAASAPMLASGAAPDATAATAGRDIAATAPVEAVTSPRQPAPRGTVATHAPASRTVEAPNRSVPDRPVSSASVPATPPAPVEAASVQPPPVAPIEPAPATARDDEPRPVEPPPAPEPVRRAEELVVSADSVIGLKLETTVSSDKARVEDRVEARVVRDVQVGGTVVIPAGSRVIGSVTLVEPGGRLKNRARLGIRFNTLLLANGTRLSISTETVYRNGEERANGSTARITGGAAAGAILGAIIGGAKGAAIGGTVGAGAGTASVMARDPSVAGFSAGTDITARILSPIPILVEQ